MGDWLGTGTIVSQNMEFRAFEEATSFVQELNLKSKTEWEQYCKSGNKPADIPSNPNSTYEKEWKGWGDWLGTGTIAPFEMEFRPFEEARQYVHKLGIKNNIEWRDYCKSGKKPKDIPANADKVYSNEWQGWYDWLGTEENLWSVRKVKELKA
jgi:hypothetical protein